MLNIEKVVSLGTVGGWTRSKSVGAAATCRSLLHRWVEVFGRETRGVGEDLGMV